MLTRAQKRIKRRKEIGLGKRNFIPEGISTTKTLDDYYDISLSNKEIENCAKEYIKEYENLEEEFQQKTGLNSTDIKFLLFATALQCTRQYIFTNDKFRFDKASDGDKMLNPIKSKVRDFHKILTYGVPYDAINKSGDLLDINLGLSGKNHRYRTLGHDPLLGWIFGTMNIITSTLTKNDIPLFTSYNVEYLSGMGSPKLSDFTHLASIMENTVSNVKNDSKILPAALIKHGLHLGSDAFTKMGLPIPILNTINPDLNSKLLNENFRIDTYSVSRGVVLSMLINSIIGGIHGLFYDPLKYESRDIYEVKTRKILLYSNSIATSSNILYTALSRDFTKLDVGGIMVTIYRLISDTKFINNVKKEFINSKLDQKYDEELNLINKKLEELGIKI